MLPDRLISRSPQELRTPANAPLIPRGWALLETHVSVSSGKVQVCNFHDWSTVVNQGEAKVVLSLPGLREAMSSEDLFM